MMRRVTEQTKGKVSKFYALCELGLEAGESESFAAIWKEALSTAELHINQRENMILQNVGNILGRYDANSQCSALLTVRERLSSALEEAKELNERMGKVYRILGITAVAIFVIVAL
jgi:stage III sporulation protein AB